MKYLKIIIFLLLQLKIKNIYKLKMEVLNALLNDALGTESESYIGIDGIKKCYNALEKLSK